MSDIPVITVDGPSGSGKGMVASHLARKYGFHLLDSGALYRLVGLAARRRGLLDTDEIDADALTQIAEQLDVRFEATGDPENPLTIRLEGEPVTEALRSDEGGVDASIVSAFPGVRSGLGALQQSFRQFPGLVADGRDMGTEVFPDADVKIYLTASAEARAERRYKQLIGKDIGVSLHALFLSIQARDERDTTRKVSPLRPADDAVVIDSTEMGIDDVLNKVLSVVSEKLGR